MWSPLNFNQSDEYPFRQRNHHLLLFKFVLIFDPVAKEPDYYLKYDFYDGIQLHDDAVFRSNSLTKEMELHKYAV
jgi:hypothetical protein